jgi:diguanylate cyclase (GGDEF)-like protein/PAS domain S-box-containing protein
MASSDKTDFQFLTENSADIICRVGLDRIMLYASPSCFHILGWTPEEMVGSTPADITFSEDLPIVEAAIARNFHSETQNTAATMRVKTKSGGLVWMEVNSRLVRDAVTGEPVEAVLVMRDVHERKLLEDKLKAQALTDGLTGLANRRAFDQALEKDWKRTLREGSQMSLLMLDLDHFKLFNDQYGHQFGDDCLRAVATAISSEIRRTIDTVARYGGEEIAVILPCTDMEGAQQVADSIRRAIEDLRIPHAGNPEGRGWVTASIGAATVLARVGGTMKMPESILLSADHALYRAKHAGRNRVNSVLLMAPQEQTAEKAPEVEPQRPVRTAHQPRHRQPTRAR